MSSIVFGTYTPSETEDVEIIKKPNLTFGLFFDGTLNNKKNTESRLGEQGSEGKAANKKHGGEGTSYANDFSNVARMKPYYQGKQDKAIAKDFNVYIEGIGTEDFQGDVLFNGAAYGDGETGIRAKVKKGCEEIFTLIKEVEIDKKNIKEFNKISIDVYGFSRGAAAARNFVHEITKSSYTAIEKTRMVGVGRHARIETYYVDAFGEEVAKDTQFPAKGHLGFLLEEAGITFSLLKVRFVGLYDTVFSYDPTHTKFGEAKKQFEKYKDALHPHSIRNAKHVFHLTADDEHRENFALTPVRTGKEFSLPGVHADIGGSYIDDYDETNLQLMDIDNVWGDGITDSEWDTILNNDLANLVVEGWFKDDKVTESNSKHETYGNRGYIKKEYSFVPLHIMCEQTNKIVNDMNTFNITNLKGDYAIPKDLGDIKTRLDEYIKGTKPALTFTSPLVLAALLPLSIIDEEIKEEYNQKKEDNEMIVELREKYLHFSAHFTEGFNAGGYVDANKPNYTISGNTIVRKREKY